MSSSSSRPSLPTGRTRLGRDGASVHRAAALLIVGVAALMVAVASRTTVQADIA
jgi:hypothetical protein